MPPPPKWHFYFPYATIGAQKEGNVMQIVLIGIGFFVIAVLAYLGWALIKGE